MPVSHSFIITSLRVKGSTAFAFGPGGPEDGYILQNNNQVATALAAYVNGISVKFQHSGIYTEADGDERAKVVSIWLEGS